MLFEITAEKSCICFITVGDVTVVAELPASYFALLNSETAKFTVAPGQGTNYFTVKLSGVRTTKTVKFVDEDGTLISRANVNSGKWLNTPEVETEDGTLILGWKNLADLGVYGLGAYQIKANATYQLVTGKIGDADRSGVIEGADLVTVRREIIGADSVQFVQLLDVNSDGDVDITDMIRLKKYIADPENVVLGK